MDKWINLIRALVRPFITISGWVTVLILASILALKFADEQMALVIIGIFTGSMATVIGFWFNERTKPKKE